MLITLKQKYRKDCIYVNNHGKKKSLEKLLEENLRHLLMVRKLSNYFYYS